MCWDNLFSGLLWSCPSAICLHKQIVYTLDGETTVTRRWDLLKGPLECCKVSSGTLGLHTRCYSAHWLRLKATENSVITIWVLVFLQSSGAAWPRCMVTKGEKAAANIQLCSETNIKTNHFTENSDHKSSATIGQTLPELHIVCLVPVVQNEQKENALRG